MPFDLSQELTALSIHGIFRFCTCWKITRTDGTVLRITDHDHPLTLTGDGTYSPQDGMYPSARQKQQGTNSQNTQTRGVISSSLIKEEDLRAGIYREAQIEEFMLDWRYPWAGRYNYVRYFIENVSFTEEQWTANLIGLTGKLRRKWGRKITRTCNADLGDARCGIDLEALAVDGTVDAVSQSRRKFSTDLSNPVGYFNDGLLVWNAGLNTGLVSEVKAYVANLGQVILWLRTPFDIFPGDTFTIKPGCNKQPSTCDVKYGNILNFRGYDTVPGANAVFKIPDANAQ